MKLFKPTSVRLLSALAIGILLALVGTKVTYPCENVDGSAGCVSHEKAIMHIDDLAENFQGSLVEFTKTIAITSILTFVILTFLANDKRKNT